MYLIKLKNNMDYTQMIGEISKYVAAYFKQHENPNLLCHNYNHTLSTGFRFQYLTGLTAD